MRRTALAPAPAPAICIYGRIGPETAPSVGSTRARWFANVAELKRELQKLSEWERSAARRYNLKEGSGETRARR